MPGIPEAGLDEGREALRRFLVGMDDLSSMLTKVALIATETIPGADAASITMVVRGRPKTAVFTDKIALQLDEAQYRLGDGPCLSAIRQQGVEHVANATDHRWPTFRSDALDRGVRAVMSTPLIDRDVVKGALNLYSETGYDDDARRVACLFADQLGVAAANAALYVEGSLMVGQLEEALESRAVIDQAKGILIGAEHCDAETAFDMLKRASQNQNRKLRDIASDIVRRYST